MAEKAYQIEFEGEAVDEDFYTDVTLLKVDEGTSAASTLELSLATKVDDNGAWDYLDDPRLELFTKVTVKIGFTGGQGLAGALSGALGGGGGGNGLEPVFDGYVTSVRLKLGSSPNDAHIEVGGTDSSVLMSLEEKIATWADMSDSDIVQQIVSAYGVTVQADPTPTVHQETDTTIVQRGTDLQFVNRLAALNGLEFYFETAKDSGEAVAYFRAPQLDGTPQPELAIQFGEESNLRSFSAHATARRPVNVKSQQMDVKAKSANVAQSGSLALNKLGDKEAGDLIGGPAGTLVSPKDAAAQMLVLGPPTSDATELQTIAQAVRDEAGWFIRADGEVNTDAYQTVLRPRRLVLVKGAGTMYSGKYYVTRVIHELKGDGAYTQKFEARRNARGLDGSEEFGGGGPALPIPGL